ERGDQAAAERDPPRGHGAGDRRVRRRQRRRPRRRCGRGEGDGGQDQLPARDARGGARRVQGAPAGAEAAPPGVVRELPAGGAVVLHAADGTRRRRAGRMDRRRDPVARLARRLLHRLRDRGAKRHPDDQPLPAPRALGGRGVRAWPRPTGRAGATLADPDDDARDGARADASRGHGQRAWARDRASARGRRRGRARHVHAPEPVRPPLALPQVREGQEDGDGSGDRPRSGDDAMTRAVAPFVAVVAVLAVLALGAGGSGGAAVPRLSAVSGVAFDAANFPHGAAVDNRWLPLVPGMELVYEGSSVDGKKRLVFIVTDLVKVVGGVRNVVVWDRDYTNGELVEAELAFFAQDRFGNVWHTGEYPEE